jgi:hypothetical protein
VGKLLRLFSQLTFRNSASEEKVLRNFVAKHHEQQKAFLQVSIEVARDTPEVQTTAEKPAGQLFKFHEFSLSNT